MKGGNRSGSQMIILVGLLLLVSSPAAVAPIIVGATAFAICAAEGEDLPGSAVAAVFCALLTTVIVAGC